MDAPKRSAPTSPSVLARFLPCSLATAAYFLASGMSPRLTSLAVLRSEKYLPSKPLASMLTSYVPDREVPEPEVAVDVGEGLDHLAAGGEQAAGADDDLLLDRVVDRAGDELAGDVPVVDARAGIRSRA